MPAEATAVLFKHVTASDGRYHPHVLAEFHDVGRGPDGRLRAVSGYHLFERQWVYSVAFEGRLIGRFHRELGGTLTRTAHGLEVKGLEALRGVKTPRQERIDQVLADKGLPRTPKTLHWAAQETHTEGGRARTAAEAVGRTRKWLRDKKLTFRRAAKGAKEAGETLSRLVKERRARTAIRAPVRAVDRVGRHVSREDFSAFARYEAARLGADPAVFEATLARVLASPGRATLLTLDNGRLTARGIERARRAWERDFKAVARGRGRRVRPLAFQTARLEAGVPKVRAVAEAKGHLARRGVRVAHADQALRIAVRAYRADGRRVLAVGTETFGRRVGHPTREPVRDADRLARDVSKASALRVFLEVRRHRWRSLDHVARLAREARRPALELSKKDVLVVHTGEVSHRAVKSLLSAARRAKATVALVNPDNPALAPTRDRQRGQDGRERWTGPGTLRERLQQRAAPKVLPRPAGRTSTPPDRRIPWTSHGS